MLSVAISFLLLIYLILLLSIARCKILVHRTTHTHFSFSTQNKTFSPIEILLFTFPLLISNQLNRTGYFCEDNNINKWIKLDEKVNKILLRCPFNQNELFLNAFHLDKCASAHCFYESNKRSPHVKHTFKHSLSIICLFATNPNVSQTKWNVRVRKVYIYKYVKPAVPPVLHHIRASKVKDCLWRDLTVYQNIFSSQPTNIQNKMLMSLPGFYDWHCKFHFKPIEYVGNTHCFWSVYFLMSIMTQNKLNSSHIHKKTEDFTDLIQILGGRFLRHKS